MYIRRLTQTLHHHLRPNLRPTSRTRSKNLSIALAVGVSTLSAATLTIHADADPAARHAQWPWFNAQTKHHPAHTSGTSNNFIADAAEKVMDSVVNILMETEQDSWFSKKTVCSRGSGFFITADGKVLTNAHVVEDYSVGSKITVTTSDGLEYEAFIHAVDFLSDLAVLTVIPDNTDLDVLWKPVKLGSTKPMRAGDWVVSIGNPFGLQNTVTVGIVSSQRRKSVEIGRTDSRVEYFQTDCIIHSGSSGGPLVNIHGEVIGINTMRADSEGISFAIKVDHSLDMINQLLHLGKIVRPWIGVGMVSLNPYVWQQLRLQTPIEQLPQTDTGVLITSIAKDSPADKAGILEGDVIMQVNDAPIESASKFLKMIGLQIDTPVSLILRRNELQDGSTFKSVDIHVLIFPQEYPTA
ncbi:trypsin-like cysteine/serine peptidase domain-containing protein [Chytriomyces cf. hyalinus JEL632]|nr:trypsin-like cysteine/serine peptidase domain-containing protein [Chytriomyces cf. hyalinus JEL632]